MEPGTIQKTILIFQDAFRQLGINASVDEVEDLAIVVDRAMNLSARSFHNPEHVFKLSNQPNPLQSLAALFHDVVYYQVDQGFSHEIGSIVSPYIEEECDTVFLTSEFDLADEMFRLALDVFGFEPGQELSTSSGLNEFLSALVALKKLQGLMPTKELFKIAVCIEATIPFRGVNGDGDDYGLATEKRLARLSKHYGFGMSQAEIEETVKLGVGFSNRDVESFAELDASKFLDDTWKLLPESNVSLRETSLYSIREYREALQKTEIFLWSLKPERIFKLYKDFPDQQTYQDLVRRANDNLCIGREYLGVKLLTMAILESLAEMTGGDAPMALFMGEVRRGENDQVRRMEDYLPEVNEIQVEENCKSIYALLQNGRASEIDFDMGNSPLSLFLYKMLGPQRIASLVDEAKEMFAGNLTPIDFLEKVDRQVLVSIVRATASLATTRREGLLELLTHL